MQKKLRETIRKSFFPEIKKFEGDYSIYRDSIQWWNLPSMIFVFFHPVGTKWTVYGSYIFSIIIMSALTYWFYTINVFLALIPIIILFRVIQMGWKIIKLMNIKKTLYEMFLREDTNDNL